MDRSRSEKCSDEDSLFRSAAVFTREGVTFDDRVNATQHLTALYGAEPKLETSAITDSLIFHFQTELPLLAGFTERLRAYQLRGSRLVAELQHTMKGLINSDDDDAVKMAQQLNEIRALRANAHTFMEATTDSNLAIIVGARDVLSHLANTV